MLASGRILKLPLDLRNYQGLYRDTLGISRSNFEPWEAIWTLGKLLMQLGKNVWSLRKAKRPRKTVNFSLQNVSRPWENVFRPWVKCYPTLRQWFLTLKKCLPTLGKTKSTLEKLYIRTLGKFCRTSCISGLDLGKIGPWENCPHLGNFPQPSQLSQLSQGAVPGLSDMWCVVQPSVLVCMYSRVSRVHSHLILLRFDSIRRFVVAPSRNCHLFVTDSCRSSWVRQ